MRVVGGHRVSDGTADRAMLVVPGRRVAVQCYCPPGLSLLQASPANKWW
jgi:hypothetical protein